MSTEKKSVGRPTDYTDDLAAKICDQIADGKSMRKICEPEEMPNRGTVYQWLAKNEDFNNQYARAKNDMCEDFAEEIIEISDDDSDDYDFKEEEGGDGKSASPFVLKENIQRSKVRIDTRKWLMSKLKPKKYGDKQNLELSGSLDISETLNKARIRAGQ